MARGRRVAAQPAAASTRTPTPVVPEPSDDEMADAPPSGTATPVEEDEDGGGDQDDAGPEELLDCPATPLADSETPSRSPRRASRPMSFLPRKRRFGRSSATKHPGSEDDRNEAPSDAGTPKRRGGFRGHRGGRWSKRGGGGPSHISQIPVDKEGKTMEVVNDEVATTPDPEGEKKVDSCGHLQDGRQYRVRTFTILGRGRRLYMLSTEPARCIGFRDSYLFFQKHRLLYKIILDDEEKRDMIERKIIPHSYKGRAIGVVTARSVFREFGAKIVIGGRKIIDEYDVQAARARGDVEGELAVPDDRLPQSGEPYNRNQYVAWHGASAVYHSGAPSIPLPIGKGVDGRKRKVTMTSDNWMVEHAREASRFNSSLTVARQGNNEGRYDIHTNIIQWPKATQPTHARWDQVDFEGQVKPSRKETHEDLEHEQHSTLLPSLDPVYPRNFMIHDLYLESAPDPRLPGPADIPNDPRSLFFATSLVDATDQLPADCRQVLQEAINQDAAWRSRWSTESHDGARARFIASLEWFP